MARGAADTLSAAMSWRAKTTVSAPVAKLAWAAATEVSKRASPEIRVATRFTLGLTDSEGVGAGAGGWTAGGAGRVGG